MIESLSGNLVKKLPPEVHLDVHGITYSIQASMQLFAALPEVSQPFTVLTHYVVREDAHILYGFASDAEKTLFRQLIKISGVGPKLALAIVSGVEANTFARWVQSSDVTAICKLPGIGKKTAERLVLELKDKLDSGAQYGSDDADNSAEGHAKQAVEALLALGYKDKQAEKMVTQALKSETATDVESIIRSALRASLS